MPPSPHTIGPYDVIGRLGQGGMGVVYQARHRETGALCALKTVTVPHEVPLAAIRREIRALAELRHPGVVRILDEGVDDGRPWYAMDLVRGRTLRDRIGGLEREAAGTMTMPQPSEDLEGMITPALDTGDDRPGIGTAPSISEALASTERPWQRAVRPSGSLEERLTLAARLCAPLAYVHGEGMVHRDLKPENVIVRDDGTVVIVDFALATRFRKKDESGEVLDVDRLVQGTLAYMSPEQLAGELVDARSDLYALGCVLYELVTGAVPFSGEPPEVLHGHLKEAPVPPSRRAPGVTPELDALVLRLLAKDCERRIGHASEVAAALRRLGADPDPVGTEAAPAPRAYLYRPVFVGRHAVLDAIDARVAGNDEPRVSFIGGESGVGKTRLAMEIAQRARMRGAHVLTGECAAVRGRGAALHPFRGALQAIADRCQARGIEESARIVGDRGRLLAAIEPALGALPGIAELREPEDLAPQAARRRLLTALHDTLVAFSRDAPTLVVIDDAQWADELTLHYLQAVAAGSLASSRLTVLATYRVEEMDDALREIAGPPGARHVVLERLAHDATAAMVAGMLALDACPADLSKILYDHSEGNPFFIAEYLRTALADGVLAGSPSGAWRADSVARAIAGAGALPGALQSLVLRRFSRLSEAARALADVASVIGREGDDALLVRVAGVGEEDAMRALSELFARQVLEEAAPGRFRFLHDKLREVAYGELPADKRRVLHRRAAEAIEEASGGEPRAYAQLAQHFGAAGVDDKAFDYLERSADHLMRAGAYGDAALALDEAIRRVRERPAAALPARRGGWERRLSQAYLALGRLDACEEHARAALSLLTGSVPASRSAWGRKLGVELARQALHLVLPARFVEEPARTAELADAAQAAGAIARVGFFASDPLRMVAASFLAVNLAERAGRAVDAARNYSGVGFMAGLFGLERLAARYFEDARRAGRETNDWPGLVASLTAEAVHLLGKGRWDAARRALDEAEAIVHKTGDPQDAELVQTLLGHPEHYQGRYEAAIERFSRVLASARARNNKQTEAWALYCTARSLLALGLHERAAELCGEAARALASESDQMSELTCAGLAARAHLGRGDHRAAEDAATSVEALAKRTQPTVFLVMHGYEGLTEVRLAAWERAAIARPGETRAAEKATRAAYRELAALVRTFPVAAPAALRLDGRAHELAGNHRRAARAFEKSLAAARALSMPFEEALAHVELGRAARLDQPARDLHSAQAQALFARLGCEPPRSPTRS